MTSISWLLPAVRAWILQYVKAAALMAGFMQLDRKLFAGHRQTLSSRCVIPSCTYSCYISRYNHVSKPHRVATSGRISRAKKEREPSGVSRLEAHKTAERLFFLSSSQSQTTICDCENRAWRSITSGNSSSARLRGDLCLERAALERHLSQTLSNPLFNWPGRHQSSRIDLKE